MLPQTVKVPCGKASLSASQVAVSLEVMLYYGKTSRSSDLATKPRKCGRDARVTKEIWHL
jgi:hypothetical protein